MVCSGELVDVERLRPSSTFELTRPPSLSTSRSDSSLRHKDYLHQKSLARALPIDSFRFDFRYVGRQHVTSPLTEPELTCPPSSDHWPGRGNHETPGEWSMAGFPKDVDDLRVVAKYLRDELNYEIETIM